MDKTKKRAAKKTKAEKKRERKLTQAQQLALEKQLVKEGKIPPRTRYMPKGYFGRILALLLAFLFGMLAVVGGILGGGYYLAVTPSRNLLHFLGLDEGLLSEEYLDKSVIDMANDVRNDINALTDPATLSLSTFSKYSPVIDAVVDTIVSQVNAYGMPAEKETLSATPLGSLASYLMDDVVMKADLGGLMSATAESQPFILALCYGAEGTNEEGGDYQIVEGNVVMNEGKEARTLGMLVSEANTVIDSLPIQSLLSVNPDSAVIIWALCYGTEGVNYDAVRNEEGKIVEVIMREDPLTGKPYPVHRVEDLTGQEELIENLTIGSVIEIAEDATGILAAIRDWTLADLQNEARIHSLRLSQILTIDESSAPLLKAMRDWTLGEISESGKVDALTLGEIISIGENSAKLLRSLSDTPIGDIADAVNELRLIDILGEAEIENNKLLRNLKMSSLTTLAGDIAALTVKQVFGSELYSYLDMSEKGTNGKTYAEIVTGYDAATNTNTNTNAAGILRPEALALPADATITETRRFHDHEVLHGYFRTAGLNENGASLAALAAEGDVYRRLVTITEGEGEGATQTSILQHYVKDELEIVPAQYEWHLIDYADGGAKKALPEGDAVLKADDADIALRQPLERGATPYGAEDDTPAYYYRTTRIHLRDGEPAEETVAYPVCADSRGIYYYRYALIQTVNEDGSISYSKNSVRERIDLARTVTAYTYEDGTPVRLLTEPVLGEDGNPVLGEDGQPLTRTDANYVVYGAGEDAQTVRLMYRAAHTETVPAVDPETGEEVIDEETGLPVLTQVAVPERWWVTVEAEVTPQYYYADAQDAVFVEEGATTLSWTATWTEIVLGEGETENDPSNDIVHEDVPVDRYLSGVWYLLFGGEQACDGGESCTHGTDGTQMGAAHTVILDNTHMPVLDIAGPVTQSVAALKSMPLWKLWLHEFISANPYARLPAPYEVKDGEGTTIATYENLNAFSLDHVIGYMVELVGKAGASGG